MVKRKRPTPRDVTYTGERVRMTDTAQERVDEQTNAERHKKAVREWSDDELTRAAKNQAGRLDEAGQFGVADLLYELTRRLRARQREGEREPVAWRWRYDDSASGWRYSHHYPYIPNTIAEPLYTEPPADTEEGEAVTLECSICAETVDVPIEGEWLRIGKAATGWTFTTTRAWICPSHPASATPDTEEGNGEP